MTCPHDDTRHAPHAGDAAPPRGDERDDDVLAEDDASAPSEDEEIEILGYSAADEAGVRIPEVEADVDLGAFTLDADESTAARPASGASAESAQAAERRAQELQAQLQRAAADFDNYRKRIERDRTEERKQAAASLVRSILPVLDSFRRALAQAPAAAEGPASAFLAGMRLINTQLFDILRAAGLEEVDTSGSFDPNVHEALMQDPSSDRPHLAIVEDFETGYRLGGRLLRPARVKVSWKPEEATTPLGSDAGGEGQD